MSIQNSLAKNLNRALLEVYSQGIKAINFNLFLTHYSIGKAIGSLFGSKNEADRDMCMAPSSNRVVEWPQSNVRTYNDAILAEDEDECEENFMASNVRFIF
jgi:hypothetical protein